jgi:hypothetical protein
VSVLNDLSQTIIPDIFDALNNAGLGETIAVSRQTETKDEGGAIESTWANVYTLIDTPPILPAKGRGYKAEQGGKFISVTEYEVKIPRNQGGTLLSLRADDRLVTTARGTEPAKTFRIKNVENVAGVYLKVICTFEN